VLTQYDRHPFVAVVPSGQFDPVFGHVQRTVPPAGVAPPAAKISPGRGVEAGLFPEADGGAGQTAVEFRQGDLHGAIPRPQPVAGRLPLRNGPGAVDQLDPGNAKPPHAGGRGTGIRGGKTEHRQHHVHAGLPAFVEEIPVHHLAKSRAVPHSGTEDRQHPKTPFSPGLHQFSHRGEVAAQIQRTVEKKRRVDVPVRFPRPLPDVQHPVIRDLHRRQGNPLRQHSKHPAGVLHTPLRQPPLDVLHPLRRQRGSAPEGPGGASVRRHQRGGNVPAAGASGQGLDELGKVTPSPDQPRQKGVGALARREERGRILEPQHVAGGDLHGPARRSPRGDHPHAPGPDARPKRPPRRRGGLPVRGRARTDRARRRPGVDSGNGAGTKPARTDRAPGFRKPPRGADPRGRRPRRDEARGRRRALPRNVRSESRIRPPPRPLPRNAPGRVERAWAAGRPPGSRTSPAPPPPRRSPRSPRDPPPTAPSSGSPRTVPETKPRSNAAPGGDPKARSGASSEDPPGCFSCPEAPPDRAGDRPAVFPRPASARPGGRPAVPGP